MRQIKLAEGTEMRSQPLLTSVPKMPVQSLIELYAIALDLSRKAASRYSTLASEKDERLSSVRGVFEVLATRERERTDALSAECIAACGRRAVGSDLRWTPIELVPAVEMSDISDSSLTTPYKAWALATRHRQREFVFWTYVIALAKDPQVRRTAESFAHQALSDGNQLRRERRLAWRAARMSETEGTEEAIEESASAALLESLLLKDLIAWSQHLTPLQRERLLILDPGSISFPLRTPGNGLAGSGNAEIEGIKRRALRRAEQLSNIYLDDADRAADQSSMELAQKLAAQSIMRLAGLRHLASESGLR